MCCARPLPFGLHFWPSTTIPALVLPFYLSSLAPFPICPPHSPLLVSLRATLQLAGITELLKDAADLRKFFSPPPFFLRMSCRYPYFFCTLDA